MKFIGVTGGIGAGKSTVLDYIKNNYKAEIYPADRVAEELESPGQKVYESLIELLGDDICTDGAGTEINRRAMAERIFMNPSLLSGVNSIVHPAVRRYLMERLQEARECGEVDYFVVEAALLIETGYGDIVDSMWYVYADEDTRVQRLMASRGYSEEKARRIMLSQLSDEEFRRAADVVIDNSGDEENTYAQVDRALKEEL